MLSYTSMTIAQLCLVIPYYIVNSKSLVFVFLAYLISGVGIGTFESNLISCLTPLGPTTKSWAVIGIPVGFNMISVGSFILFSIWPDVVELQAAVYLFIVAANIAGLLFYIYLVPNIEFEASSDTMYTFLKDLKCWREWFPTIWKHCVALMIDMCCVSIFSAVALYIFDAAEVPIVPRSTTTIPKNAFDAIYYCFSFMGDFTSRKIAYRDKPRNPFFFLVLSCIGVALVLSKTAVVAPLGMFCVMFANGSIYAQTTKFVDVSVPKKYNLMALSVWLFIGDIGSFCGSQAIQPLRTIVGPVLEAPAAPPQALPTNTTVTTTGSSMRNLAEIPQATLF